MKSLKEIIKKESGQTLPIVLILLAFGGLLIAPALGYASTTLKVGQMHKQKMAALYAADAGIEDALHKIVTDDISLSGLAMAESYSYPLESLPVINNLQLDSITVTKWPLVYSILGENEYKLDQPHSGWIQPGMPYEVARTDEYVEYSYNITIDYDYETYHKNIWVTSVGVFFSPYRGDALIECPYDVVYSGVLASVAPSSITNRATAGGWAVIWRWDKGVKFDKDHRDGSISFKFKIWDPDWELGLYFAFLTTQSQDISYSASKDLCRWAIKAEVGDTSVRSCVIEDVENDSLNILTWEINPPA